MIGQGVEQENPEANHERAAEWYSRAAKQGHSIAQYNLGECYRLGKGPYCWINGVIQLSHVAATRNGVYSPVQL